MIISLPNHPCDKVFEYNPPIHDNIQINDTILPYAKTIIFFHITTGKYIRGYNNNGQIIFSYHIPISINNIFISESLIKFFSKTPE